MTFFTTKNSSMLPISSYMCVEVSASGVAGCITPSPAVPSSLPDHPTVLKQIQAYNQHHECEGSMDNLTFST